MDDDRVGGMREPRAAFQQREEEIAVLAPGRRETLVEAAGGGEGVAPVEAVGGDEFGRGEARRVALIVRGPVGDRHDDPAHSAAPSAAPASPAADCTHTRANEPWSRSRAFITQLRATPPARHKSPAPLASRSQRAISSAASSSTIWSPCATS